MPSNVDPISARVKYGIIALAEAKAWKECGAEAQAGQRMPPPLALVGRKRAKLMRHPKRTKRERKGGRR